jgi:hypothetical protein
MHAPWNIWIRKACGTSRPTSWASGSASVRPRSGAIWPISAISVSRAKGITWPSCWARSKIFCGCKPTGTWRSSAWATWGERWSRALVHYEGFTQGGFCVKALFDHNPHKVGQRVGDLTIYHVADLPRVVDEHQIRVALLAVPPRAAQEVADHLIAAGVRAILNYAPTVVKVPPYVRIRHIDPVVALQSMTYYLEPEDE